MFNETLFLALSLKRPHGSKNVMKLRDHIASIRPELSVVDPFGNLWVTVDPGSKTIFTAHLDTVHGKPGDQPLFEKEGIISSNDILGADDGAGCAILAGMISHNIAGTYVFTLGEECGGLGAKFIAKTYDLSRFDRAIAFDRKGFKDICGMQGFRNMASREFVSALSDALGMGHRWSEGIYTDNAEFVGTIPEIVNISCGYANAHTNKETLDLQYLMALYQKCLEIDWEMLPVIGPEEIPSWKNWNYSESRKIINHDDRIFDASDRLARKLGISPMDSEFDEILDAFYSFSETEQLW